MEYEANKYYILEVSDTINSENSAMWSSFNIYRFKDLTVGIANKKSTFIADIISPNPVANILNLKAKVPGFGKRIEIYDLHGNLALDLNFAISVDVSRLVPGVYTIKCGEISSKFVKE